MTPTLQAAAWAICESIGGPRCEELCPGCIERAETAGRVWLGAAKDATYTPTHILGSVDPYANGHRAASREIAAAIEALIGEKDA